MRFVMNDLVFIEIYWWSHVCHMDNVFMANLQNLQNLQIKPPKPPNLQIKPPKPPKPPSNFKLVDGGGCHVCTTS